MLVNVHDFVFFHLRLDILLARDVYAFIKFIPISNLAPCDRRYTYHGIIVLFHERQGLVIVFVLFVKKS